MLSWEGSMLNRTALWMGSRSEAAARSARAEAEAARKVRRVMRTHSTTLAALTKIDDAETANWRLPNTVSHIDPEVLALRALGETAGTHADDAHLSGCAHCQAEFDKFAEVVTIARRPGPGWKPALA